jgi:hypothetical protein
LIKELLPNCRWLAVASDHLGRDWSELSRLIDEHLDEYGLDLAEESVYLLFDRAPGSIQVGEGHCLVGRSVIGPKKNLVGRLHFLDWVQRPVFKTKIIAADWPQIYQQCYLAWENLQRQGLKIGAPFMILAKRRLNPRLELELEVLFHE